MAFNYKTEQLLDPTFEAIHSLGGSASVSEIEDEVARILKLSDREINDPHRGSVTKLAYRLAWARNALKLAGLLANSERGVWSLTKKGKAHKRIDGPGICRKLHEQRSRNYRKKDARADVGTWEEELLEIIKRMRPDQFERMSQRLLRELGFVNVEVTGRTGDGGIDGHGVVLIQGVLGFHVVFQCKKYRGSVRANAIRDFRGATVGRAEKGLLITTGTFTRDAKAEAQREGAPAIDLLDGQQLAERMRQLRLGVVVETIEQVKVDSNWFQDF